MADKKDRYTAVALWPQVFQEAYFQFQVPCWHQFPRESKCRPYWAGCIWLSKVLP